MPHLICFGDSITAKEFEEDGSMRLTPRLRAAFPHWQVTNAGVPGDNTNLALLRLQTDVLDKKPDLVTVLLGTNDAALHKQVDIVTYKNNLAAICRRIGPETTILLSPPPANEELQPYRKNALLGQYAQTAGAVAAETGSHFLDLFTLMINRPDYPAMLKDDGVHFAEAGYGFLAGLIAAKVSSARNGFA